MKVKEVNWHGIKHDVANEKFSGGLTYIRSFEIFGTVWAVYKVAKPNRKLGHKKYLMLGVKGKQMFVSGISAQRMYHHRFQHAMHCLACDTVIYSINTHHAHSCGCKNDVSVDGGREYLHISARNHKKAKVVQLDLITGKLVDRPKSVK